MTRRQLFRTLIGLKFLKSGDAHIWYLLIPRRKKSWRWKADEMGMLMADIINHRGCFADSFFKQASLSSLLRSPAGTYSGGTYLASPLMYPGANV